MTVVPRPADTRRPLLALVAAACLGSVACPRPHLEIPRHPSLDADQLLETVARSTAAHHRALGLVKLEYLGLDGIFNGEADLALESPGSLRAELRTFFGTPAVAMVVHDDRFIFIDNGRATVLRGSVDAPQLEALLPLAVPPALAIALMLGRLPELPAGKTRYTAPERGWFALKHSTGSSTWLIEIANESGLLRNVTRWTTGASPDLLVEFSNHRRSEGVLFPLRGKLKVAGRKGAVTWTWLEVEINGAPADDGLWSLDLPPGFAVEEL